MSNRCGTVAGMTPAIDRRPPTETPADDVRAAWASLLAKLLTAHGYTTPAGRPSPERASIDNDGPVPASVRTIRNWLNAAGGVTGEAIRDTLIALGRNPVSGAIEVGWYPRDVVSVLPPDPPRQALTHKHARWVQRIMTSDAVPQKVRDLVDSVITRIRDLVEEVYLPPAPIEPSKAQRDAGATVREARRR